MPQSLLSATLGLSHPWRVTSVFFSDTERRLEVGIDFHPTRFRCRTCGNEVAPCHVGKETWFHADFLNYATYLHARVPHIHCCGEVQPVERPWSRAGSRFAPLNRPYQA